MATRWHDIDWDAVFAGRARADRYFARPGLIRKDRLALFAPAARHPATASAFDSFGGFARAVETLRGSTMQGGPMDSDGREIQFVLKKAHSSNASGIRFLSGDEACAACQRASGGVVTADVVGALRLAAIGEDVQAITKLFGLLGFAVFACAACVLPGTTGSRHSWRGWSCAAALSFAAFAGALAGGAAPRGGVGGSRRLSAVVDDLVSLFPPAQPDAKEKRTVWIIQRHVRSALIRGRKFHLRALLLCVGDLDAYVHSDVRALLATEPFDSGMRDGSRLCAHVTNMGVQRIHEPDEYDEGSQNISLEEAAAALENADASASEVAERILSEICSVMGDTLEAVRAADRRQFFTLSNCWELFGVDFLVEACTCRVVLLEVNPSPSLAMYGESAEVRDRLVGPCPLDGVRTPGWRRCFSKRPAA
mmetsp:Transcript_48621/g.135862  ORF Transcript_48621/g.135862 Transcript_48621/m.135862 type:complete len:422 (+) Transcript_48621:112-1377(+)